MARSRVEQQVRQLYEMCAIAIVAGRADLDGADEVGFDIELPVFTVGRAAELANVHPQTLRQYDRLGLVVPRAYGRRCPSILVAGRIPPCAGAAAQSGRGHQSGWNHADPRT